MAGLPGPEAAAGEDLAGSTTRKVRRDAKRD